MTEAVEKVAQLRRPRLLVRAAQMGLEQYNRTRQLARLLPDTPAGPKAFPALLCAEEEADKERRSGAATYSAARHIELLVALLAEARIAR